MINQKQQKLLNTLFETGHDLHILIMNVEAFSTKKGVDFAARFLSSHNKFIRFSKEIMLLCAANKPQKL